MKIKSFLFVTILVAVSGLSISAAIGWQTRQIGEQAQQTDESCETAKRRSAAVWKEVYQTPDQLIARVDTIVLAEAVSVAPSRTAFSANGEDELPFELVTFRVSNPLKGAKADEFIYVERAGGVTEKGRKVNIDFDGGDFEIGNSYLLFLKRQEEGPYFYQVNDQGRYKVVGDELKGVFDDNDSVKSFFKGKAVDEGLRLVKEKSEKSER